MVVKQLTAHAIHFCLSLQRKLHIIYFMKTPLTSQFLVNLKNYAQEIEKISCKCI